MKIKLSKSDWELIGQKTGWMKTAQNNTGYMPGQTPYTDEELKKVHSLVGDAAAGDPGEAMEKDVASDVKDDNTVRRREIKVIYDDGDFLYTTINGTKEEIKRYYIGRPTEKFEDSMHTATRVIFLQ